MRNLLHRIVTQTIALLVPHAVWRRAPFVAVALTAAILISTGDAFAEIVLDDFDESFELLLPRDISSGFNLSQTGVGPLGAKRLTQVTAIYAQPTGKLDANITQVSALTFTVEQLNRTYTDGPGVSANLVYRVNPTDITQAGANDRVLIDFRSLRSAVPLAGCSVFLLDESQTGNSHYSQLFAIPSSDSPFTLEFPYASFRERGSGVGQNNFQEVYSIQLSVFPTALLVPYSGPDKIAFSAIIDRIRFGNAIPEPSTSLIACSFVFAGTVFLTRKRRCSDEHKKRRRLNSGYKRVLSGACGDNALRYIHFLQRLAGAGLALVATVVPRATRRFKVLVSLALTAANLVFIGNARAEIVLDEFDNAFEIKLPDMNGQYQTQSNIGPLAAQRSALGNACCGSRPTGLIDANSTVPSALFSSIDRVNADPVFGAPAIGVNILYFFNTLDVTQGGTNDRVTLDLAYLRSAIPMARVTVAMQDATDNYVSQQTNIAVRQVAFSLDFLFSSFTPRGGGIAEIDATHVHTLYLTLTPVYFTQIDPLNFSTAVERIRFTNGVPEPATGAIAGSCIIPSVLYLAWKKRRSHDRKMFLAPGIAAYYSSSS